VIRSEDYVVRRIKSGDIVQVISGDDVGKVGKVLRCLLVKGQVVVEGVNQVHKHHKRSQKHPQGGRVTQEAPIAVNKVALYDQDKGHRVKVRFDVKDGKKVRVSRKDGKVIAGVGKGSAS
jgi:large subunit ribosomal protein L24